MRSPGTSYIDKSLTNGAQYRYSTLRSAPRVLISAQPLSRSYTDVHTGLTNGIVYRYALAAEDTLGHASALSLPKLSAPKDLTGPDAVTLSGSVSGSTASLSWTEASDPSGIGSYRIMRATGTGSFRTVATISVTAPRTFSQTGLAPGTYSYVVRPIDTRRNVGQPSNVVSGSVS